MQNTLSLSFVMIAIVRHRKMVARITFATAVAATAIALVLPKWYEGRASILPPDATLFMGSLQRGMLFAGYQPGMIPSFISPSDLYAAILKSETVMSAVIDSLGLMEAYRLKSKHRALKRLKKYTSVSVTPEGVLRISYEDKDRERAAELANAYVRQLDNFTKLTRITGARKAREFVEKRIAETERELEEAEQRLKQFKEQTGAVFISEQAKASIETAAGIFVRIAELEAALERLRSSTTEVNPEVANIRSQIRALDRKLEEMGYSRSSEKGLSGTILFPKFRSAPEIEQRYAQLMRDVEVKNAVLRVLRQQYEEARIDEVKDTPTLQVLDWAKPPPVRSRPKRKQIVVTSSVIAFLLSSFLAVRRVSSAGSSEAGSLSNEVMNALRMDSAYLIKLLRGRRQTQ